MTDGFALKSWVISLVNKVTKKTVPKYSTDESVVGTWINGKPIYRRVIQMPQGFKISNTNYSVVPGVTLTDYDLLINANFMAANGTGTDTCNYAFHFSISNNTIRILSLRNNTSDSIYGNDTYEGYIVIEYTKMSDKAAS